MMVFLIQCFEPEAKGPLVKCMAVVWERTVLCLMSYPCYNTVRASDEKSPIEATNFSWSPHCLFLSPPSGHTRAQSLYSEVVIPVSWWMVLPEVILSGDYFRLTAGHCGQCVYCPRKVKYTAVLWQLWPLSRYYSQFRRENSALLVKLMWWEVTFSIKPSEIVWHCCLPSYSGMNLLNKNYFIVLVSSLFIFVISREK
jgi:hypothetical protein